MSDSLLIRKQLPSGATCYIIPRKGYVSAQCMVCTRFGSMDTAYTVNGVRKSLHAGAAHFLEHKLFESPPGKPTVFEAFAQLGAEVNAFTNFDTTAYYFSATENVPEALDALLDFVFTPHLTDENVEKEKGIITQEIRMYDDDPYWASYFGLLEAVYAESPVRVNIAGAAETVNALTAGELLDAYDTFYRPRNMAVICAGDFVDADAFCDRIDRRMPRKPVLGMERDYGNEPSAVRREFATRAMHVSRPIFHIGVKDTVPNASSPVETAAAKLLLDLLCGEGSALFADLFAKGLVDEKLSADYQAEAVYGVSSIAGASDAPQAVYEAVLSEANRMRNCVVSREDFERIKRKHIGRFMRGLNSLDALVPAQCAYFAKRTDLNEMRAAYENVTPEDVTKRLEGFAVSGQTALSVVE